MEPTELVEEVANVIEGLKIEEDEFVQNGNIIFKQKKTVPVTQLFALYAINKIYYAKFS